MANIDSKFEALAEESILFLTKTLRLGIPMDDPADRARLGAATTSLGAWTRHRATNSQKAQTELVIAAIAARDIGGKQTDYLADIPEPRKLQAVNE